MGAGHEFAQRSVLVWGQGGKIAQPRQAHLACGLHTLLFLVRVVGHEGSEAFGPVARLIVGVHAIAPPVVQHLVAERCRADERQAQDVDAQVSHCGHAETGL